MVATKRKWFFSLFRAPLLSTFNSFDNRQHNAFQAAVVQRKSQVNRVNPLHFWLFTVTMTNVPQKCLVILYVFTAQHKSMLFYFVAHWLTFISSSKRDVLPKKEYSKPFNKSIISLDTFVQNGRFLTKVKQNEKFQWNFYAYFWIDFTESDDHFNWTLSLYFAKYLLDEDILACPVHVLIHTLNKSILKVNPWIMYVHIYTVCEWKCVIHLVELEISGHTYLWTKTYTNK